jgi:diguanylate cyclase (GGDEF)-like protein
MRLLQQSLAAANRDGFKLVVGIIDLDDFARVNAEHGQLVADAVLLQLSGRLHATLRGARGAWPDTADQIARLHGDEFAVLMRVQTPEEAQHAVDRLLGLLATPVAVRESRIGDGLALEIGASMGATLYPLDDADPETLLRHAGHALYRAKHAGRGVVQFHDPTLDQRDEAGLIALARLQRALDSEELLLHYQPQIDLRTGQVMGVEALLRWQHPERGLLAPAHFLPLIETSGLAVQLGDWVIEQALAQTAAWARAGVNGGRGLPVSVNVGARQLSRPDFPQRLQELMQRQLPEVAHLLHLDVLEADALAETAATQALIQRCLALGVGIALDDFGAGYSRLSSLKRLTVDTLKLDRSYVQGMLGDAQDLSLVESVIGLARNIGCAVVAKGVESRAHARELLRLGCRLGQGNGIAAAMHPMALPGWIDTFANSDWAGQLKAPLQAPL